MHVQNRSHSHRRRAGGLSYMDRIMKSGPVSYWPLNEQNGNVAVNLVDYAMNGVHNDVNLGYPGIGDGETCPLYDTSYTTLYTTMFKNIWPGTLGSAFAWVKVLDPDYWINSSAEWAWRIATSNATYIAVSNPINNQLAIHYLHAGSQSANYSPMYPSTDWNFMGATWSYAANEIKYYYQGVQLSTTKECPGEWTYDIIASKTLIGGAVYAPVTSPWHGCVAHLAIWNRRLSEAEINDLYNV